MKSFALSHVGDQHRHAGCHYRADHACGSGETVDNLEVAAGGKTTQSFTNQQVDAWQLDTSGERVVGQAPAG